MAEILLPQRFINALNDVKRVLGTVSDEFSEVRLFGSCAKGSYTATSDIDILILTKNVIGSRERREYFRELVDVAIQNIDWKRMLYFTPWMIIIMMILNLQKFTF